MVVIPHIRPNSDSAAHMYEASQKKKLNGLLEHGVFKIVSKDEISDGI